MGDSQPTGNVLAVYGVGLTMNKKPPNRYMECTAYFDGKLGDQAPRRVKDAVRKQLDRAMRKRGVIIAEETREEVLGYHHGVKKCVYGQRVGGWRR